MTEKEYIEREAAIAEIAGGGMSMGVYINGMEMPEHCGYCRFRYEGICHALQKTQYSMEECPLVPVPPHGRLIDADEFLKRAIGTKCFRGDYALMLEELVGESTTIVPEEDGEYGK